MLRMESLQLLTETWVACESSSARNVQQVASGAADVSAATGEVNRGASDTGSAASQVHACARTLHEESKRLAVEVRLFLDNVRAA